MAGGEGSGLHVFVQGVLVRVTAHWLEGVAFGAVVTGLAAALWWTVEGLSRTSPRYFVVAAFFLGFAVGLGGSAVRDRRAARGRAAAPNTATPAGPSAPSLDSPEYWKGLTAEERAFLILLWRSNDTFLAEAQFNALRHLHQWDIPTWNRMQHSLLEARRLVGHGWVGNYPGWFLTRFGKQVLSAADLRGETAVPTPPPFNKEWKP